MAALVNTAYLLGAWAMLALGLTWLGPELAQMRLVNHAGRLRDEVVDEILAGHLPSNDPAVQDCVEMLEVVQAAPHRFGLTESLAIHKVHVDYGDRHQCAVRPSYARLQPEQRKFMNNIEGSLNRELGRYLITGSRLWFLLLPGMYLVRGVSTLKNRNRRRADTARGLSRRELAADLRRNAAARVHSVPGERHILVH